MKSKILLVDSNPIVRVGIRHLIESKPGLTVCGEASDVAEALDRIEAERPDLVIMELLFKDSSGYELIQNVKAWWKDIPILVLSMYAEEIYAERAKNAGADAYVMKTEINNFIPTVLSLLKSGGEQTVLERGEEAVHPESSRAPFNLIIDPDTTTSEEAAEILLALSGLYKALGGEGFEIEGGSQLVPYGGEEVPAS